MISTQHAPTTFNVETTEPTDDEERPTKKTGLECRKNSNRRVRPDKHLQVIRPVIIPIRSHKGEKVDNAVSDTYLCDKIWISDQNLHGCTFPVQPNPSVTI